MANLSLSDPPPPRTHGPGLVVTLGPSSFGKETELAHVGVAQFRVNSSHLTIASLRECLSRAQQRAPQVPTVVDLQGAKMRLGNFESRAVSQGQLLSFVLADCGTLSDVPLPHPEPYQVLRPGDTISIDDGRLLGTVVDVTAKRIEIRMGRDGVIAPRKGFNRADHPVVMDDLSAKDIAVVETAYAAGCRCFALSFVATGHECAWVRRRAAEAEVIAKIERQDGLSRLNEIAQASDAVWICRGDLGAQLGLRALGRAISEIEPHKIASRLWMAGQVLEHLTAHGEPTRSEVCHLHDLLARGYVGIVLSDETAIGCDPVNAAYCARGLLDSFFDVPGDPGNNERLRENSMLGGCPRP